MYPKRLITEGQTVADIQQAMAGVAAADAPYYSAVVDRLALPADTYAASKKVFDFLKTNCAYRIEPETKQRVMRLPALLHYCGDGIDCKNYSLFAAGAMAAHARRYQTGAKVFFRYAGYGRAGIEHVFCVVDTPDGEIWIDPVLAKFDQRNPAPYIWQDKPVNMALYQIGKVPAQVGFDPGTISVVATKGQALMDIASAIPALLSKKGVAPGFFQRFSFLRVLDNSTGKWKSRAAFLADKTPNERISFYIEAMQAGEGCDRTIIQYPELYGHQRKADRGTPSDVGQVDPQLVALYNSLVQSQYLKGAQSFKCGKWDYPASYLLLPGGVATNGRNPAALVSDFLGVRQQQPAPGGSVAPGAGAPGAGLMTASAANPLLITAAIGTALYFLWKKA